MRPALLAAAAITALFTTGAGAVVGFMVFIADPTPAMAACMQEEDITVASDGLFDDDQAELIDEILAGVDQAAPEFEGVGLARDYVATIVMVVALEATGLEPGPFLPNAFAVGDGTTAEVATQYALEVGRFDFAEAVNYTPALLASAITAKPSSAFEPWWLQASTAVAYGNPDGTATTGVGDGEALCAEALLVSWDNPGLNITNGVVEPLLGGLRVTSTFGYRLHPITGEWKLHAGTDYGAACGNEILAVEGGQVVAAYESSTGAGIVAIAHPSGVTTRYIHMRIEDVYVFEGQQVFPGQIIALVGNEGGSTGCHLHFETYLPDGRVVDSRTVYGF